MGRPPGRGDVAWAGRVTRTSDNPPAVADTSGDPSAVADTSDTPPAVADTSGGPPAVADPQRDTSVSSVASGGHAKRTGV
ncbi:hypothetical protein GCM10010250_04920 [Streptomyces althioticus]|nr:hypothetical protein GCM10010250_04920 [Streptomyces althioticus]